MQLIDAKKGKCCCNCKHDKRTWEGGNCTTTCDIDGHYIGYVACFETMCEEWEEQDEDNLH